MLHRAGWGVAALRPSVPDDILPLRQASTGRCVSNSRGFRMLHRSPPFSIQTELRPAPAASPWLRLALLAMLGALANAPAQAGVAAPTCEWTGGSGATSLWSDPANWNNCGGAHPVPADGDIVRFP